MIPFAATLQQPVQQKLPVLFYGLDNPGKFPLPLGGSVPHLIHGSMGQATAIGNMHKE